MSIEDKRVYLVPSTNEDNNAFVGVRIRNESIEFHYPESYDLSGVDETLTIKDLKAMRRDMIDILHTISLAKTRSFATQKTENGVSTTQNFAFMSYLWIIRDYITNGIYRNTEKIYRNNAKGRVNWKKTLATQPIISNGNIIYNNLVVEVINDCDSILTDAHRLCIYNSIRKVGWLFGINEKAFYVPSPTKNLLKKYVNTIKLELKKTFDDTKKSRLNHMLKVLSGVDDSKQISEIVYGVDKYHYVYERMVDAIFSNIVDITKYNPNASWFIKEGNTYEEKEASSLRPDTVRIDDSPKTYLYDTKTKTAYVLDAKFYRYGSTGKKDDLPETTSIQKQITYATHIKNNLSKEEKIEHIHNAFVLPYNKNKNSFNFNENLVYIGFSKANWVKDDTKTLENIEQLISSLPLNSNQEGLEALIKIVKDYAKEQDDTNNGVVHAFLIDTKHLVTSWSQGNCKEDIERLINDIETYVENHNEWHLKCNK